MSYTKADPGRRVLAVVVDSLLSAVVSAIIPVVGGLIAVAYMLTRDRLMFEITKNAEWENRSIGKKILGLKVVPVDGGEVDLMTSVKRNVPLSIGSLISIIPLIGWILGGLIGFVVGLIELILAISDAKGRRWGDRWAGTQVVLATGSSDVIQGEVGDAGTAAEAPAPEPTSPAEQSEAADQASETDVADATD